MSKFVDHFLKGRTELPFTSNSRIECETTFYSFTFAKKFGGNTAINIEL